MMASGKSLGDLGVDIGAKHARAVTTYIKAEIPKCFDRHRKASGGLWMMS